MNPTPPRVQGFRVKGREVLKDRCLPTELQVKEFCGQAPVQYPVHFRTKGGTSPPSAEKRIRKALDEASRKDGRIPSWIPWCPIHVWTLTMSPTQERGGKGTGATSGSALNTRPGLVKVVLWGPLFLANPIPRHSHSEYTWGHSKWGRQ